jgi:hypothetical protein
MKDVRTKPEVKDRDFNSTYSPKIKKFQHQPRMRIRQLLRSFTSFDLPDCHSKGK